MERDEPCNESPPRERGEEAMREDRILKREVDQALREWDRLEESALMSSSKQDARRRH